MSFKAGMRMSRLSMKEPIVQNVVGKLSTEFIYSEQTKLIKSKLFTRMTKKIGGVRLLWVVGP